MNKVIYIAVICLGLNMPIFGQVKITDKDEQVTLSAKQAEFLDKNEEYMKEWLKELQTPGVSVDKDKMTFNKEAQRLINDVAYRNSVYKDIYTYDDVKVSLAAGEYIKAIWQLLTIYPERKEHILQYIYAYDKVIPSDELVVNAFYTYAFFDPRITTIENGKPNIYRPDIFEDYLRRTKEIVSYINYFREQEVKKVQN
ncbi:hypothetical protein [Lutibacter sp.]|uniref:hypothetical protein n=1 Tax=Lutibacter sp. TaxID=1925666 RepID=UPI001A25AF34|nr:hypothetical protein [Lutibacter sp.]MBI9042804.1 hypothetical protein [Lutibacter sp.]